LGAVGPRLSNGHRVEDTRTTTGDQFPARELKGTAGAGDSRGSPAPEPPP
jgi:hypothetical protein